MLLFEQEKGLMPGFVALVVVVDTTIPIS